MERKYQVVYNELLHKIEHKSIQAGALLPSENDLMKTYKVSRDTIRKALNLLSQNGHISKAKGKGSIVLDNSRINFPVSGVTSFKELAVSMGDKAETIVTQFDLVDVDSTLKWELMIDEGKAWKIERIRKIDEERIICDIDHINAQIIPGLTKAIAQISLYDYIENTLGLNISFAKKEITVQNATQHDFECLDMQQYTMVVCVKSFTYLEDATLFQYTESRHRPDKFRFIDFARRDI